MSTDMTTVRNWSAAFRKTMRDASIRSEDLAHRVTGYLRSSGIQRAVGKSRIDQFRSVGESNVRRVPSSPEEANAIAIALRDLGAWGGSAEPEQQMRLLVEDLGFKFDLQRFAEFASLADGFETKPSDRPRSEPSVSEWRRLVVHAVDEVAKLAAFDQGDNGQRILADDDLFYVVAATMLQASTLAAIKRACPTAGTVVVVYPNSDSLSERLKALPAFMVDHWDSPITGSNVTEKRWVVCVSNPKYRRAPSPDQSLKTWIKNAADAIHEHRSTNSGNTTPKYPTSVLQAYCSDVDLPVDTWIVAPRLAAETVNYWLVINNDDIRSRVMRVLNSAPAPEMGEALTQERWEHSSLACKAPNEIVELCKEALRLIPVGDPDQGLREVDVNAGPSFWKLVDQKQVPNEELTDRED